MWEPFLGTGVQREKALETLANEVPLKRIGVPLDVAYSALYLAFFLPIHMPSDRLNRKNLPTPSEKYTPSSLFLELSTH